MVIAKKNLLALLALCLVTAAASFATEGDVDSGEEAGGAGFCDGDFRGTYAYGLTGFFGANALTSFLTEAGTIRSNGHGRAWGQGTTNVVGLLGPATLRAHYECIYHIEHNGTGWLTCKREDETGCYENLKFAVGIGDDRDHLDIIALQDNDLILDDRNDHRFDNNDIRGSLQK